MRTVSGLLQDCLYDTSINFPQVISFEKPHEFNISLDTPTKKKYKNEYVALNVTVYSDA